MKAMRWMGLCLLVLALLAPAGVASAEEFTFTYSDIYPATHFHAKLVQAWIKEVEKRTDGRVKIVYYPGGALTSGPEIYDGVVNGLSDLGHSVLQYTRGRFPLMDFINLPAGYTSGEVATAIVNEVNEKFHPQELADTKIMYLHAHGPGFIHTRDKDVTKMEDLKGLKLRSHGPTADMLQALGATPVALPMPELYQAMERGVVSGGVWAMEADKGWKLAEVANRAIACYPTAYSLGFFVAMNLDKWNSLPPDIQKIIEDINLEWAARHGRAWDQAEADAIRYFLGQGGRIIGIPSEEASRWVKAVQPVIEHYKETTKGMTPTGAEVMAFADQRLADAAKGDFSSKYAGMDK